MGEFETRCGGMVGGGDRESTRIREPGKFTSTHSHPRKTVTRLKKVAERDLCQVNGRLAVAKKQAEAGNARHGIDGVLRALENAVKACPDDLTVRRLWRHVLREADRR